METIQQSEQGDEKTMVGINLGAYCNQNCVFCLAADGREVYRRLNLGESLDVVRERLSHGARELMFTGGEMTINPDFIEIISETLKDPRVKSLNLMTNGVRIGDKDLFDALIKTDPCRKISFSFSLHGSSEEVTRHVTRGQDGDFAKTCAAINYAIQSGRSADIAFIIVEQNYRDLPTFADFIVKSFPKIGGISFGFPLFFGNAEINKDWIYVRVSNFAPLLSRAIKILSDNNIEVVTAAGAPLPLCAVPGVEEVSVRPLVNWQRKYIGTATSGKLNAYKDENVPRVKPVECDGCVLRDACPGLLKEYSEIFGSDGVDPVTIDKYKGPVIEAIALEDALPKLHKTKVNLIVLSGADASPGVYVFPNGEIGIVRGKASEQ